MPNTRQKVQEILSKKIPNSSGIVNEKATLKNAKLLAKVQLMKLKQVVICHIANTFPLQYK